MDRQDPFASQHRANRQQPRSRGPALEAILRADPSATRQPTARTSAPADAPSDHVQTA